MSSKQVDVLATYKQLVDLLLAESTDDNSIRSLMTQLGIEYKETKLDRLAAVLAFDPRRQQKGKMNDLR